MTEKFVQLRTDVHHPLWTLLRDDHVRDFVAVGLPVWFRDRQRAFETWPLREGGERLRWVRQSQGTDAMYFW